MAALRKALRPLVPLGLRRMLARYRRARQDRAEGLGARLARIAPVETDWPVAIALSQAIKQSDHWQGKLANLKLGAALIDGVRIEPGQVFSFWALIGAPTARRGFALGRSIRADRARGDTGGGLCQLSGLIYELGLRGGLQVIERHPHSRDLYLDEADRFTPLGLDATVVWPWKDLRLENRLDQPVVLRLELSGFELRGAMLAAEALQDWPLEVERTDLADHRLVEVRRGAVVISCDRYSV